MTRPIARIAMQRDDQWERCPVFRVGRHVEGNVPPVGADLFDLPGVGRSSGSGEQHGSGEGAAEQSSGHDEYFSPARLAPCPWPCPVSNGVPSVSHS